jgi:cytochrome c oxidase subunit 4
MSTEGSMSTDMPTTAGATVVTGRDDPPSMAAAEDRLPAGPAEAHRVPHPEPGEHGAHPTDKQYMLVALILAGLTAIEVAISYIKGLGDASAPLLLVLAAVKFFLVVSFFMHLKFDNKLFRRLLVTGIILAITVYTIVFFELGVYTPKHGIHG